MTNVLNTPPTDGNELIEPATTIDELCSRATGAVLVPDDPAFAEATQAWNRAFAHRPVVVVDAADVNDVVLAVGFAAATGVGLGVQTTGHGVVRPADDGVLLLTRRLDDVVVDPEARTAWVGGGATWEPVLARAQAHGLAPLLGSSPNVGAVGYVLGGGFGWLARKHGSGADSVRGFEIVTPDGRLVRASATENRELFRALRGGGGGLGVVTGMEIELHPVTDVYGGNLLYPAAMAEAVVERWAAWIADAPDELTSEVVFMNFPPIPEIPEPIRGGSFTIVRGCWAGDLDAGRAFVDRLRSELPPIADMWQEMPFSDVALISNDPVDPLPAVLSGGWLDRIDGEVGRTFAEATFPADGPPVLMFSEVRHVGGGAVARGDRGTTMLGNRDLHLAWHALGVPMTPEMPPAITARIAELRTALGDRDTGRTYLNFTEGEERRARVADALDGDDAARLRDLKHELDPAGVLRFGVAH